MANIEERIGLGPLVGLPTIHNLPTLTTSTKATLPYTTAQPNRFVLITIVNGSTTATVAYTWVALGANNPNITADYNATTGGIALPPGAAVTFSLPADKDVYVAASASATVCVASCLFQQ